LYSIRVKCDVVKPRKPVIETHPLPVKASHQKKPEQSEPKFAPIKLGLSILFLICLFVSIKVFLHF
jgi:hypothetical protein